VLVRKAQPLAPTIQALREALAPSIQEPKAREAFLLGTHSHPSHSQPIGKSSPSTSKITTSGRVNSQFGALGPSANSMPMSARVSAKSQPYSQPHSPSARVGTSMRPVETTPEELIVIEQTLSKFIGPMAKMLVRKETGRTGTFKDFVEAIAGNIDHPQQRELFLQALKRALPRRQQ
jgi:hypothetical protein